VLVSVIDSFYTYVATQMATIDPTQKMAGIISARDWPLTAPIEGALYLAVLAHRPVGGTESQIAYAFTCQWLWFLRGTNIGVGQQAEDRGDRYRRSMVIATNIRNAHYPGFCSKRDFAVDGTGNITQTGYTSYLVGGAESVRWTRPAFAPRQDDASGLLYEAATTVVTGMDDVLTAIA